MKSCKNCLLPETHETIEFNNQGICNICDQHKFKKEKIDWNSKQIEFENILKNYRGKYNYDCIVPFSGGKDSVFTLYKLVKEYKLKVQSQIQGEQLRVSAKKIDDLQNIISELTNKNIGIPLQFVNMKK